MPELEAAAVESAPKNSAGARRVHWSAATFAVALALVCGSAVFTGLPQVRLFGHDVFFFLDNGYRVAQGQIPHRDFSSAWGPLIYLIDAAGLLLARMRPEGIAYANALFAAIAGVWAYWVGRTWLRSLAGCWIGIYTVLLIAAPFPLGYNPLAFSNAMVYNRYGFALLGIILVECCGQAMGTGPAEGTKGGISSGAALALLGFLKISYALMAVPFLVLGYAWGCGRRKRLLALCAASAAVSLAFCCYLRFDLPGLFRDLAMAASGRGKTWQPAEILSLGFGQLAESVPLLLLAAAVALAKRRGVPQTSKLPVHELSIVVLTLGVGGVLLSSNHQPNALPLDGFAALVLANAYLVRLGPGARRRGPRTLVVAFLTAACVLPAAAFHWCLIPPARFRRM